MRLVIDVGNTSISYAYFNNNKLVEKGNIPTLEYMNFKTFKKKIKDIIYASVVPQVDDFFEKHFSKQKFFNINYKNIKNVSISLKNKGEIGIDRLVNAEGAVKLYGKPLIIIDFGTATTFCIVDEKKVYQGGIICPGINMSRINLHQKTAKLPLIELEKQPKKLIGKNTRQAMEIGIIIGYQSMIEGLIRKLKEKHCPNYKVLATGGYAELISNGIIEKIDYIDQELTLKSLNIIGETLNK